ncbi:MAG: hypothetical protein DYG91_09830 [Chloroflexi bacterium CFX7]|nr:hypothetical protein [Chloroflexi bacterium CFX7]RIL02064.1 MAG: hypothetical protein DCC78_08300 [bacterium]
MTAYNRPARTIDSPRLRLAAIGILLVPALALLALALGELSGGEASGVQHIPEAAVPLALAGVAWWRARPVGIFLLVVTPLLFVAWAAWVMFVREEEGNYSFLAWIAAAGVLFLPPLLAGWLLVRSSAAR